MSEEGKNLGEKGKYPKNFTYMKSSLAKQKIPLHQEAGIYIKLDVPIQDFFKKIAQIGVSQHWATVHGDVVNTLKHFANLIGVTQVTIE